MEKTLKFTLTSKSNIILLLPLFFIFWFFLFQILGKDPSVVPITCVNKNVPNFLLFDPSYKIPNVSKITNSILIKEYQKAFPKYQSKPMGSDVVVEAVVIIASVVVASCKSSREKSPVYKNSRKDAYKTRCSTLNYYSISCSKL